MSEFLYLKKLTDVAYTNSSLYLQLLEEGEESGKLRPLSNYNEIRRYFANLAAEDLSSGSDRKIYKFCGDDLSYEDIYNIYNHVVNGVPFQWYIDKPHQVITRLIFRLVRAEAEVRLLKYGESDE